MHLHIVSDAGAPGGYETKDLETHAGEIIGDIDILHASHHGSASSSHLTFLETIRPETVIISVGEDNDYGHPSQQVLDRFEHIKSNVYRTDLQGSLEVLTDGETIEIRPF